MTLENQYENYLLEQPAPTAVMTFDQWKENIGTNILTQMSTLTAEKACPTSVADLESHIEELTEQNKSLIHAIFVQQRDQKRQTKAVKEIVSFLEYEEGLTKDPTTQKRITQLLKKHNVWS